MNFKSINISKEMIEALEKLKIFEMTDIQKEIIPIILKGKNVVGISDTGSGKTYAFLVPLLENIIVDNQDLQAVIISPTRELATQLFNVCTELVNLFCDKITVKKFVGGAEKSKDINKTDKCQIAIGTPGRIHDLFINENALRVKDTKMIVIDEADMVFEDNYMQQVDEIKDRVEDVSYMIFSATINQNLSSFIKKYLKNTSVIDVSSDRGINPNIEHRLLKSKFGSKDRTLVNLLEIINPYACLIFASSKKEVERIFYLLSDNGFKCAIIHGDLDARKRARIIKDVLKDKYQYVVCSDIASRGLDLNVVTHVISYDLPRDLKFYAHRGGRSARYDNKGISYVIYDEKDLDKIGKIRSTGIEFSEYKIVNNEEVEVKKQPRKFIKKQTSKIITKKPKRVSPNYKKKARRGK